MTDFSLLGHDLAGLALAGIAGMALLLLPGALAARALSILAPETRWRDFAPALAFAYVPILAALTLRHAGITALAAVLIGLALAALLFARDFIPRPSRLALGAGLAWWLYIAFVYVDCDVGGRLYQSLTVLDLVKHAAVIRELAAHGAPLHDPFFARPETAGYYHYFYDGAAALAWLGGSLIDPRMAFAGAAFCTGLAMASLVRAFVVELGWQRASEQRLTALTILVCALGGFDLVGIGFRWATLGILEPNSEWWDDEISFFPTSASWVPHHLAAVMAGFLALLLLAKAVSAPKRKTGALLASSAGIAMASAFGLSVWVTVGAAGVLAICIRAIPADRQKAWIVAVAVAGIAALLLSVEQLLDLARGRADGGAPIGLWIREPARLGEIIGHPLNPLFAMLLTPAIWLLEFGPLAIGAWLFWKRSEYDRGGLLARLFAAAAAGGLLMNFLLRSTIINNDFGWRVAWFAALPAMVWTIAVLQRPLPSRGWKLAMGLAIAFGLAATAYNLVGARFIRPPAFSTSFAYINADPAQDYALAAAYRWAARHLPPEAILQHNPLAAQRVFDFGLYGTQRVGVADVEAGLFGAPREAVLARARQFGAIFAGKAPISEAGPVYLVVTSRDALWRQLPATRCVYRSAQVCIAKGSAP